MKTQRRGKHLGLTACAVQMAATASAEPAATGPWTYDANCRIWAWKRAGPSAASEYFDGVTLEVVGAKWKACTQLTRECVYETINTRATIKEEFVLALVKMRSRDPATK